MQLYVPGVLVFQYSLDTNLNDCHIYREELKIKYRLHCIEYKHQP